MDERKALEDLIPNNLRSKVVKCQNAMRFYIHVHQVRKTFNFVLNIDYYSLSLRFFTENMI